MVSRLNNMVAAAHGRHVQAPDAARRRSPGDKMVKGRKSLSIRVGGNGPKLAISLPMSSQNNKPETGKTLKQRVCGASALGPGHPGAIVR